MIGVLFREISFFLMVLLLALGSWILPERAWHSWARRVARYQLALKSALNDDEVETIKVVVGDRSVDWIHEQFRPEWLTQKYLAWMTHLACSWPRRWSPSPDLIGRDHLETALANGRGVLLLTSRFVSKDLMAKASLSQAGHLPCQLSNKNHGFSSGLLCRWILNPIYTKVEDRFLGERLTFSGQETGDIKVAIKERLSENRIVLVAMTPLGRRVGVFPFLRGQIRIATGALNLACDTGTPMLPSFTIRTKDGRVQTIIEKPLDIPMTDRRSDVIDHMLADYVRRLETYVTRYPEQFTFPTSSAHGDIMIHPLESTAQAA